MKECLVDVLNSRNTVLHVFSIPVENQDGTPKVVDTEQEALKLAASTHLVSEEEAKHLHVRPHVERGGQLTPYGDVLEDQRRCLEKIQQRVRERAYFLWEREGCAEHQADEYWHRASKLVSNAAPM